MNKTLVTLLTCALLISFGWFTADYLGWLSSNNITTSSLSASPTQSDSTITNETVEPLAPVDYQIEQVATGLKVPWALAFTSEARMLVTERPGNIRVIEDGELLDEPLISFPQVSSQAEEGLMGLAIDPNYQSNRYLYACYAYPKDGALVDTVVRLVDNGDTAEVNATIIDNIPAARFHAGCELAFGPDGMLYITTGDATDKQIAQDMNSLGGKILRLNPDGSIPNDNPFPNSPIYSLGHRNPQGIGWSNDGVLYSAEHGPSVFDGPAGGDEINLIKAGENYGWPIVSHDKSQAGLVDPLITYTPAVAPGSLMVYSGKLFPQFRDNIFFAGLKGEGIYRVTLEAGTTDKVAQTEKLDLGDLGRMREVVEAPSGEIYVTTSNTDGRGILRDGDDKIYLLNKRK